MPKSQAPRKKVKSPEKKKQTRTILDELKTIDTECQNMLKGTAKFAPFLRDDKLVQAGDQESIFDNSKILARDTIVLKRELDAIRADFPKKLHADNPNHVIRGHQIGERYNAWQEKYTAAVLPTVERLGQLLEAASDNYFKVHGVKKAIDEGASDDNA